MLLLFLLTSMVIYMLESMEFMQQGFGNKGPAEVASV